jgi:hypothetical protein
MALSPLHNFRLYLAFDCLHGSRLIYALHEKGMESWNSHCGMLHWWFHTIVPILSLECDYCHVSNDWRREHQGVQRVSAKNCASQSNNSTGVEIYWWKKNEKLHGLINYTL